MFVKLCLNMHQPKQEGFLIWVFVPPTISSASTTSKHLGEFFLCTLAIGMLTSHFETVCIVNSAIQINWPEKYTANIQCSTDWLNKTISALLRWGHLCFLGFLFSQMSFLIRALYTIFVQNSWSWFLLELFCLFKVCFNQVPMLSG